MSSRVEHLNKKTGVSYVYDSESYWNKEKQQARSKQVCIGKIDPVTGEFVPSKRLQARVPSPVVAPETGPAVATAAIVGPSLILDALSARLGLAKILKSVFPDFHGQILTMAYYLAAHGGALSQCVSWTKTHEHPSGTPLDSQRISEILGKIGTDGKQTFMSAWMDRILEDEFLCYDITSVSSYSELNQYIRFGHNRDRERLPQLNLAMLFGQKSRVPAYYHRVPGNITDVHTVHNLLETFKKLEIKSLHYVLDRGFYSKKNIDELLERRDHFTISVPLNNRWVREAIDEIIDSVQGPESYQLVDDEALYVNSRLYPWGDDRRRCYLHLYYNDLIRSEAVNRFNHLLLECKEELESGKPKPEHQDIYDEFFVISATPVRGKKVSYNTEAVSQHINRYAGFQALLTTRFKEPLEALQVYRDKDVVEKSFDDLKNALDMKRLRMHSIETVDGRLFVQFIALILMSELRREMRESKLIELYTVRELLLEMDPLTKIRHEGKYGLILTEVTKPQREILSLLKIKPPSSS